MKEFNNSWQVKSLGEVVRISKGKKLNSLVNSKTPTSRRFIQIDDLRNNEQLKFTEDNSGVLVEERDVLIAWDGANAGTVGFGLEGFIGSTIARLELLEENISTNYIGWLLRTKSKYLRDNCTGATIPHINKSVLTSIKIPLPPLPIQKQIAEILEKADDAKQKRKEANKLTDEFLQSVFIEMFGDPNTNTNRWDTGIINDAIEYSEYGTSNKSNEEKIGYPVLGMSNITYEGQLDLTNLNYVELTDAEFKKLKLEQGDIIFNRTNSTELVGKTTYWNKSFDAVLASYLVKIKLNKKFNPIVFSFLLNTTHFKKMFVKRCKKAVGQSNISPTLLKEFPIYFPPLSLQQQFAEIVNETEALKEKQKQSEQELENLFQSLMQKAFKGELVS